MTALRMLPGLVVAVCCFALPFTSKAQSVSSLIDLEMDESGELVEWIRPIHENHLTVHQFLACIAQYNGIGSGE